VNEAAYGPYVGDPVCDRRPKSMRAAVVAEPSGLMTIQPVAGAAFDTAPECLLTPDLVPDEVFYSALEALAGVRARVRRGPR
jgi:hypothetical protein